MTLGRLLLAFLPVAVLFALAPTVGYRWDEAAPPAARWEIGWRLAEAGVVTLFASLWFDSLGAGGWPLLFLLLGLLVAFQHVSTERRRRLLAHAALDVARYLLAGALLAWRLA